MTVYSQFHHMFRSAESTEKIAAALNATKFVIICFPLQKCGQLSTKFAILIGQSHCIFYFNDFPNTQCWDCDINTLLWYK